MTSFSLRQVKLRPGEEHRECARDRAARLRVRRAAVHPGAGEGPAAIRRSTARTPGTVFTHRVRRRGCTGRATAASATPFSTCRCTPASTRPSLRPTSPTTISWRRRTSRTATSICRAWARDTVALALPDKILCRPDCAGLCPQCGKNLNDEPHDARAERRRLALGGARGAARKSLGRPALHQDDVAPGAVLLRDPLARSDDPEAAGRVEGDRGVVAAQDAGPGSSRSRARPCGVGAL